MAATITAAAEVDQGRVRINAAGGTPGDAFYVIRRDQQGSNLIRETTGDGMVWQPDPATQTMNLFTNPDSTTRLGTVETRRNHMLNPDMKLPTANLASTWAQYTTGTVTGTQTNDGTNGQKSATSSIATASRWGITTNTTFTSTTAKTYVKASVFNGLVSPLTVNTMPVIMAVDFKNGSTIVSSQSVVLGNAASTPELSYAGGAAITNVDIWIYIENTTGATVTAAQQFSVYKTLVEQSATSQSLFSGASPSEESGDVTYAWVSTANASASVQYRPAIKGAVNSVSARTFSLINGQDWASVVESTGVASDSYMAFGDNGALRNGMVAGKTYTASADITVPAALSGSLDANALRIVAGTKVGAAAAVYTQGAAASNAPGTTRLSVTFTVPAGATEAWVRFYSGSAVYGQRVFWDHFTLNEGTNATFFDGGTRNGVWTGAADDSTSTKMFGALAITVYDYECKQGLSTDYIITDDVGRPGAYFTLAIPVWGTWLKDPFRPFMNCRVLWNQDGPYTRAARRERLQACGAKFPVFHSDKRAAPAGNITVATEDNQGSRALMSLLDGTDVVMVDVDPAFGVPVRYVSVGDISGDRVGDKQLALTWEARYWTLPVDEVAMPIGAPITQGLTYDQLAASFGSYVSIPASVDTYDDLAAGVWS